mgnify:CR=1 FL=1
MIFFPRRRFDPGDIWPTVPTRFGAATGTDMFIGRNAPPILRALGVADVTVDYVVVDTLRVPRQTFADIITAWRDGYVEALASGLRQSPGWFSARFDQIIASILDPAQYAVWFVPVVSGRVAPGDP